MLRDQTVFTDKDKLFSHYNSVRKKLLSGKPVSAIPEEQKIIPEPVTETHKKSILPSVRVSVDLLEQYHRSMDGLAHSGKAKKVTMSDVLERVAKKYGMKPLQLKARVRRKELTEARFEAFYIMRKELKLSFPQIARFFGMDHTSIIHGVRKHEQKKEKNNG